MNQTLRIVHRDSEWNPKYFGVICGLFCGLYMITTAINAKIISVYGIVLPAGIISFSLCCILADLLTEVYGFNRTRQAIWTTLLCLVLFSLFAQAAIMLPSAGFWPHQEAFKVIFASTPRFAAAGCVAWVVGEFANSYIMSRMKKAQKARHMSVRFVASTAVGQFFDTLAFSLVAFAGTMPWPAFFTMIASVWAIKVSYEIVILPLSVPFTAWVKKKEGVEHFDDQKLSLV